MRVVIAPDKFKGSLTATQAARAIALGVQAAAPHAELDLIPMADGGEGTTEAMVRATGGEFVRAEVSGPLGDHVYATFGLLGDGETGVIEMAAASGLGLVKAPERDPQRASTRGTGELLKACLDAGARRIIVGIGGSATNDGGAGFAQALGYRLLDRNGREIQPGGWGLADLDEIVASERDPRLEGVEIAVACDVQNPLVGPDGATRIYGPQKFPPGHPPNPDVLERLDQNLARLGDIVERDLGVKIRTIPGGGAAGGLGAGLLAFAGGRLEKGVELVVEAVGLHERLVDASLCLTGEGSLDGQTASGKTVAGVAEAARRVGVPVIALAGTLGEGVEAVRDVGVSAYFSICGGPMSLAEASRDASRLLKATAEQVIWATSCKHTRHRAEGGRGE